MPAGKTYTPIATAKGNGTATSVTFSSIPGGYTDLVLVASLNGFNVANEVYLGIFPGQSIHSNTLVFGNGTSATSTRETNRASFWLTGPNISSGGVTTIIASILNYSNTNVFKTALIRVDNSASGSSAQVGLGRSTSAVTEIFVATAGAAIPVTSTFTLYGIAAA